LVLINARVYAAPAAAPFEYGVVIVRGTTIAEVGARSSVPVPADATIIDCGGSVVLAGYQNSHVLHQRQRPAARSAEAAASTVNGEQAVDAVTQDIGGGADIVKLFTGSWVTRTPPNVSGNRPDVGVSRRGWTLISLYVRANRSPRHPSDGHVRRNRIHGSQSGAVLQALALQLTSQRGG